MHVSSEQSIVDLAARALKELELGRGKTRGNITADSTQAPLVALSRKIIEEAAGMEASDIHIEPDGRVIRVRYRIDGQLREKHQSLPGGIGASLISCLKVMAKLNTIERRLPQDGRMQYLFRGRMLDIRISVIPLLKEEKAVLRILNHGGKQQKLADLDFSPVNRQRIEKICSASHGLILCCGPVNSGKTTTLYAMLQKLNAPERNLITIEDPVEYRIPGINQMQVNNKIGLTFARGVRAILRQDPDVVMVGEIRDEETAAIAVRAALTGHLLLTTLHTAAAAQAVFRLLDMKIPAYLLSSVLLGIIAQRLVPRLCPHCRRQYVVAADSAEGKYLGKFYAAGNVFWQKQGCPHCQGTGYKGRIAIQEVLLWDSNLRQLILDECTNEEIVQAELETGMISLKMDGIAKARQGEITLADLRRFVYE